MVDILVLGTGASHRTIQTDAFKFKTIVWYIAGITGRLVVQYLNTHRQKASFTFGLAGRSQSKLSALISEFSLNDVPVFTVDVSNAAEVESVICHARVIINTIGPYWFWGNNVVSACVRHGKHYVDLTGEPHWVKDVIATYDYAATQTGSIVVPFCGLDSIPSDLLVFVANKTLKAFAGSSATIDQSTSAWTVTESGLSGGTVASMLAAFEEVPRRKLVASSQDFCLSPVQGVPNSRPRLVYTLPFSSPPVRGPWFVMAVINRQVVFRTWGLHELTARLNIGQSEVAESSKTLTYGPNFKYEEFIVFPSFFQAFMHAAVITISMIALSTCSWARKLARRLLPKAGDGPSDENLEKGAVEITNITTSTDSQRHPTVIRTTFKGRGEPGYLLSSIMVAESALCIILNGRDLPPIAKAGGVLTPMSAFGDVLVERLKACGRIEVHSEILLDADRNNSDGIKKTR
ncbi:Saccharopine dehydrogenase-domain-containing protein [Hygrophoropsis aurantiaca]|uniref:Saccharopine dehydrogenase-domain-containing protein n=1 Tax=Hygrophoropsis aurantiaca TaxID=72124 RepID=A0ACB8A004_9AGAM|nr:Saccharopine dehydrogenase-domain-containing protein [Hygrophoropsis aurantiaca]